VTVFRYVMFLRSALCFFLQRPAGFHALRQRALLRGFAGFDVVGSRQGRRAAVGGGHNDLTRIFFPQIADDVDPWDGRGALLIVIT